MPKISASKVAAAAGDYAAGDIVSESASNGVGTAWQFKGIESRAGQGVHLVNAIIVNTGDAVAAVMKLWLFTANPSASELDDNAAKSFAAADMANLIGIITFKAGVDQGAVSTSVVDQALTPIPLLLIPAAPIYTPGSDSGPSSIWGVLETAAEANEAAGQTITINLYTETTFQPS